MPLLGAPLQAADLFRRKRTPDELGQGVGLLRVHQNMLAAALETAGSAARRDSLFPAQAV
jgi:hypothetical protein